MSKQQRKKPHKQQKVSKFQRACERCGNENFSFQRIYKCQWCGWKNGVERVAKRGGRE